MPLERGTFLTRGGDIDSAADCAMEAKAEMRNGE